MNPAHSSAPSRSARPFLRLFALCALVGVAAGIGAVVFYWLLQAAVALVQHGVLGLNPAEVAGEPPVIRVATVAARPWLFLIVPALGGLVSGIMVWLWAPEAEGHGTDAAIRAYHRAAGHVRSRVPFVKILTSAITIGSGGSGGREGPIAQVGAGFGSWLGRTLNLQAGERRVLMAAGMGAGVGAIFRAPLAGALFAGEILYASALIEPEVIVPSIISSIVAYSIFGSAYGWDPLFKVPDIRFTNPLELVPYTFLAVAAALVGRVFVKVFYGAHRLFRKLPGPRFWHPCLGGLLTGLVGFMVPAATFTGYGDVQEALLGHRAAGVLALLAVLRILTTSFSIGSGGSGGVFGPSMVIGGCLGGAMGSWMHQLWPAVVVHPAAYVVVGMAGFFGGIAHAPISTIIMVSEMTGNYQLLVPAMWVSSITFALSHSTSLYEEQVAARGDSPAHRAEFQRDMLDGLTVQDAMTEGVATLRPDALLTEARDLLDTVPHHHVPVVDERGVPVGLLSAIQVHRRLALANDPADPELVGALMRSDVVVIGPHTTLREAAAVFASGRTEILLVADSTDPSKFLGVVTQTDLLKAREQAMESRLEALTGSGS